MRKHRTRDRPATCKDCREYKHCMEASRMYPCRDFTGRPMTDRELTGKLLEMLIVCLVGLVIYIQMGG